MLNTIHKFQLASIIYDVNYFSICFFLDNIFLHFCAKPRVLAEHLSTGFYDKNDH